MSEQFIFTQPLSFFEIEEKGAKRFFVKGNFSTTDKDLVNDICTPNCLNSMVEQIKSGRIKLDFEHEAFRGDSDLDKEISKTRLPVAKAIDAQVKGDNAEATWELNSEYKKFDNKGEITMTFDNVVTNIQDGMLDAFSIAYIPTKSKEVTKDGESVRLLDDVRLLNVALTGNPINTSAQIQSIFMKSLDAMERYKIDALSDPKIADKVEVKERDAQGRNTEKPKEEDEEEEETKKKKYKKAYEKDGAHAHTEAEPLGLHNHQEIEETIRREVEHLHDRISSLIRRLPDKTVESPPLTKSHSNETNNHKEVKTMTTEKKDEVAQEIEEAITETAEEEPKVEAEAPKEEASKETMNEVKALIVEQNAKLEAMSDEIKSLKAEKVSVGNSKALMSNDSKSLNTEVKAVAGMGELS